MPREPSKFQRVHSQTALHAFSAPATPDKPAPVADKRPYTALGPPGTGHRLPVPHSTSRCVDTRHKGSEPPHSVLGRATAAGHRALSSAGPQHLTRPL